MGKGIIAHLAALLDFKALARGEGTADGVYSLGNSIKSHPLTTRLLAIYVRQAHPGNEFTSTGLLQDMMAASNIKNYAIEYTNVVVNKGDFQGPCGVRAQPARVASMVTLPGNH